MLHEKPNMQPSGNLDLQPGDNEKNMTEEEGREGGPSWVWGFDKFCWSRSSIRGLLIVLILHLLYLYKQTAIGNLVTGSGCLADVNLGSSIKKFKQQEKSPSSQLPSGRNKPVDVMHGGTWLKSVCIICCFVNLMLLLDLSNKEICCNSQSLSCVLKTKKYIYATLLHSISI